MNQKCGHWKKCTAMQNTERSEKQYEWPRTKGKSTNHYKAQCDAQAKTGTKGVIQKRAQGK